MASNVTNQNNQKVCCCLLTYKQYQVSCMDAVIGVLAIATIVIGSLWIAGIFSPHGQGVIFPGVSFGAAAEGGFCVAVGGLALAIILGRIISPSCRKKCEINR